MQYMETRVNRTGPNEKQLKPVRFDASFPSRHLVLGRYLRRSEWLDARGQVESWTIVDAKSGKCVTVDPKSKRFVILNGQVTIDSETGQTTEDRIKPAPKADFYSLIREVPANATTRLPAKMLGDKQVVGFVWEQKIARKEGRDTWKRTYWIDPNTRLPVRVEISYVSVTDRGVTTSDRVQSDFVFDKDLAESLFSTQPPKGYSVHTEKIYGYRP